jgi:inorganic pyrophosphatase/exopolyphosphatase
MSGVKGMIHSDKKVFKGSKSQFVKQTAAAIVQHGAGLKAAKTTAPTEEDAKSLARIAGMTIEEFNSRLAVEFGEIANTVAAQIRDMLASREFKPSEMAYLLSVIEDKRATLNGRAQVSGAQVNVQINNYGDSRSKEEILASLFPTAEKAVEVDDVI